MGASACRLIQYNPEANAIPLDLQSVDGLNKMAYAFRSIDHASQFLNELARRLFETNEIFLLFGEDDKHTSKQFGMNIDFYFFEQRHCTDVEHYVRKLNAILREEELNLYLHVPFGSHYAYIAEHQGLRIAADYSVASNQFIIKCLAGTRYV